MKYFFYKVSKVHIQATNQFKTKMSYPIIQTFNPEFLKAGDLSQLSNWLYGTGSSIYVRSVPTSMNEELARYYFGFLGTVSRIDFVTHKTGTGRMMFVHFNVWNDISLDFRKGIASAYPLGYNMYLTYPLEVELICSVNITPIPVVEYNIHQLADMFEKLKTGLQAEVLLLRQEVAQLRQDLEDKEKIIQHQGRDLFDVMSDLKYFDDDEDQDYEIATLPLTEQQKSAIRRNIDCAERHIEE